MEKDGGRAGMWYVIDGSKTPMLYYYYYDSERSLHVGLSISDAPLGRTMLIRRGQLFREENLKRSGAIFEVMARAANTRDHRVVAADNFCHFKCRRVLFLIVISQPKSSFAEDIYR